MIFQISYKLRRAMCIWHWLVALLFLWQDLIRHLAVEWSVNPRYSYCWAVPFLCGYLLWRNRHTARQESRTPSGKARIDELVVLGLILALLFGPTRLIQEANPEWRLVSWALAIEVVGLTVLLLSIFLRFSSSIFPFLFFFLAVPWPTLIEVPIIRTLTSACASATVTMLEWLGIPSALHGSVIETCAGWLGIDEACSGIRSFQASLMIALFFGEIYHLAGLRRIICILAGLGLSLGFNVLRTTLLACVAATKGTAAISTWHDPTGLSILLGCFSGIWLLALWLRKTPAAAFATQSNDRHSGCYALPARWRLIPPLAFVCWVGFVEIGTQVWYRLHENRTVKPLRWHVEVPRDQQQFQQPTLPPASRQMLRFDYGLNAVWCETSGLRWQAIFLSWNPGAVAVNLARNHMPEDCLVAGGYQLIGVPELSFISVQGLNLPFRSYVARDQAGLLHVYYCLWEDSGRQTSFRAEWLSYANRLRSVMAGQRNLGQRSLQLALWGAANDQQAIAALKDLLPKIIRVDD